MFEFVEKGMPDMLPILPMILEPLFNVDSIIMETTPREFLFDGVHFCQDNPAISEDIREVVRMVCGLIAMNAPKTIRPNGDGSLRFSLYGHVRKYLNHSRL